MEGRTVVKATQMTPACTKYSAIIVMLIYQRPARYLVDWQTLRPLQN
ncbi:unnamed protein product [Protopolystoma xenopodis]|uniref:Uncharacterized protein n=1 Tax=Protopolystoma xenopodis TaxID=117903 RepID=A0A3S5A2S8_9PLAT|nr:unnamed protein product [Protopolystoma xenopodis]